MNGFVEQYLVNVAKMINNPPSAVVGVFAQNLYEDTNKLTNNVITAEEYNNTGYLEETAGDTEELAQAKRSLNYIKSQIFKDATGYFETAKYDIPNEVKMNKDELVLLYGPNKRFYAHNGILERSEIENLVEIQFGLQYYLTTTIIAVDEAITAENFVELV